jgi:hypothetical protein
MAISEEVVNKIVSLRAEGKSQTAIGVEVGLSQTQVSLILRERKLGGYIAQTLPKIGPIHLVARNPLEMSEAQADLGTFFERKIASIAAEVDELSGAIDEAVANGWKTATLDGQHRRAMQRKLFYEKCLVATRAGYTVIPDIPIDVFAIRTSRTLPRRNQQRDESSCYTPHARVPEEQPQILSPGEGEYQNPDQFVRNARGSYKDDKGKEIFVHKQWATEFDAIEFPVIAAVPYVMNATQAAMNFRVFDQIGISPQGSVRSADPLIIGQILGHRKRWSRKTVSFLIAWHLDLRTL